MKKLKKLTFQQFIRWYSNLPISDRVLPYTYFIRDNVSTISTQGLYELLNEQEDKRREVQVEIDRLLAIAKQIMR